MIRLFRKLVERFILPRSTVIYSQAGEDLIMARLFYGLQISMPTYLDIGANDPRYISNTYYFYTRGSRGVCVEPNPYLYRKLRRIRSKDVCINAGIGITAVPEADFYLFPDKYNGLSTFSKESALYWENVGMQHLGKIKYEKVIRMPLVNINTIIEQHLTKAPDILSIDVEGLDLEILASLDMTKYRPVVICVETLAYDDQQGEFRSTDVESFLKEKGYSVYADTRINTLFIANEYLSKLGKRS